MGCTHYTAQQRVAAGAAVTCGLLDVGTTLYAREGRGMHELNPLMQNYALGAALLATSYVLAYAAGEHWPHLRTKAWLAVGQPHCGAAVWNAVQLGR